ncbi:hypothetical protein LWI29_033350 [Acer saccharum]|uniref:Uncharacterized protein n=1 Tax=Acer saccharum TaxID=4024 RepID=A0AA39RET4_ACESA|nr:hypothetical protein LWI29_033350 [Acer saccharum]
MLPHHRTVRRLPFVCFRLQDSNRNLNPQSLNQIASPKLQSPAVTSPSPAAGDPPSPAAVNFSSCSSRRFASSSGRRFSPPTSPATSSLLPIISSNFSLNGGLF